MTVTLSILNMPHKMLKKGIQHDCFSKQIIPHTCSSHQFTLQDWQKFPKSVTIFPDILNTGLHPHVGKDQTKTLFTVITLTLLHNFRQFYTLTNCISYSKLQSNQKEG